MTRMNVLRERLAILAVAAISVAVLALLGATGPDATVATVARSAVPISMTRLVADAKAGQLANAVVDEASLVVQATYGPGAPLASAPAGPATDGGTLSLGAVAARL